METEHQPSHLSNWRRITPTSFIIVLLVFTYSIVRYNVIKGVSYEHLPLFISNKAIALGAVVLISISYLLGNLARFFPRVFSRIVYLRKYFGLLGFGLASIHTLMSLILLRPYYYGKFFDGDSLNLVGELSLLFGVIALFIFSVVAIISLPSIVRTMEPGSWRSGQRKGYIALMFVMTHVYTMGIRGWLTPDEWPGGLLPISLVAFIAISFTLLVKLVSLITVRHIKPIHESQEVKPDT
jgi:DMSO/TMAO reductase YedYZ heme-binding membrane subunit